MARANLTIDESIFSAFLSAQDPGSTVRCLKVCIRGESLVLNEQISRNGSVAEDFNSLKGSLSEQEACLLVFCIQECTDIAETCMLKWMLLAWVPDGSKVREKMLYSSSREDLKRSLGLGYFSLEYAANVLSDIEWTSVEEYSSKSQSHVFLSASERLINEERTLSHIESTALKSTAMGVMPFEVSADVGATFVDFNSGSIAWVELRLVDESVHVADVKETIDISALNSYVNPDEARFIILRIAASIFFVFSCPENVPVRSKMTMSSSKASVVAVANMHGINFNKTLEIRSPEDLVDTIRLEMEPVKGEVVAGATTLAHAKPLRPGRGKAKVSKFVVTDNDD